MRLEILGADQLVQIGEDLRGVERLLLIGLAADIVVGGVDERVGQPGNDVISLIRKRP
jgi:hypothetical protein